MVVYKYTVVAGKWRSFTGEVKTVRVAAAVHAKRSVDKKSIKPKMDIFLHVACLVAIQRVS